jgi:hypothetical protein
VKFDIRAEGPHRRYLRVVCILGHTDGDRNVELSARVRDRLSVVPCTRCDESVVTKFVVEVRNECDTAADFERAGRQCVLTLEIDLRIEFRRQPLVAHEWCLREVLVNAVSNTDDIPWCGWRQVVVGKHCGLVGRLDGFVPL